MTHAQNEQSTDKKQNLARFFLEQRHIAWVSLAVALLWGIYGLLKMPQRKDPDIPVRQAMIIVPWQGTSSEQVEQLVTRKIEQAIALNQWVTEIKSASRTGSAMVQFELAEKGKYDRDKELDDVKIRLDAIHDLPQGAGPILYIKDFGDTSALMLTVASPPADPAQVNWVSKLVEAQIRQVRSGLDTHTQTAAFHRCGFSEVYRQRRSRAQVVLGDPRHGNPTSVFRCASVFGSGVHRGGPGDEPQHS